MSRRACLLASVSLSLGLAGSAALAAQSVVSRAAGGEAPAADWPVYSGDYSSRRHSTLSELTPKNVGRLQAKWVYGMYLQRDMQATPVVANGVMYISQTNRVDALDARTGALIWQYQRQPLSIASQRGTTVWNNRVFVTTSDRHIVALDSRSGAVLWDVPVAEGRIPAGQAHLVADGKLIVTGNQPHGFIQGYDALSGKHLWTWTPIPEKGTAAYATWGGAEPAGMPIWLSGSFDQELNLIYYGTGQPEPQWAGESRKGDNLYSDSVVALNAATGKLVWHFQFTPHDTHDWDAGQMPMLVDAPWKGRPRKLMLWANRNGFYYVLDRATGEFLQATPFVSKINWLTSMDGKGYATPDPARAPTVLGSEVCPSTAGATNWPAPSYDPALKTVFVVAQEGCSVNFRDSTGAGGYLESQDNPWQLYTRALDAFTGEKKWEYKQTNSVRYGPGLLSTAGGVVFTGEKVGQLSALDSRTGKPLWNFFTGGVITSGPMSYEVDGHQYIGLVSGSNVIAFALPDPMPASGGRGR